MIFPFLVPVSVAKKTSRNPPLGSIHIVRYLVMLINL
jgi:hypothetical protein